MTYTILHISDLHRTPDDPIGNDVLLSALVSDCDRWASESPTIPWPDAIVVSGDLVQGVALGQANADESLSRQYDEASDFLTQLTDQMLGGVRSNVVLVPGNHDVDRNIALSAMAPLDGSAIPRDLRASSFGPESDLRWDWRERRAYRIVDQARYRDRFGHFETFVNDFYRFDAYRANEHFMTFSLFGGRIGVAAFNSCHGNDCFSTIGDIPAQAIARAHLALRDNGHELLVGVWHHSVEGGPLSGDYMDVSNVYTMIGNGFRLGLHGHQHRAQASHRYIHLPQQQPMALVSAGSLCAGPDQLPTGVNRQYNIVVISDDLTTAQVHVREMIVSTVFGAARRPEFGGSSFIELELGAVPDSQAGRIRQNRQASEAERALADEQYEEAIDLLAGDADGLEPYPRELLVLALSKGSSWQRVIELIDRPRNVEELLLRVRALAETGNVAAARDLLDDESVSVEVPAAQSNEIAAWLSAKERLS